MVRLAAGGAPAGEDAPAVVDALIAETVRLDASDLHLLPEQAGLRVQWRVDGILGEPDWLPAELAASVVTRLKVLAKLLTYETQTPQEGQFRLGDAGSPFRISTFPTLFGEKVVVRRLPSAADGLSGIDDLGLLPAPRSVLAGCLAETSGAVLIVGPSGSGKTTTAYAALREIVRQSAGRRSIATLEDPIEVVLPGVAQSQAAPHAGFDLWVGLRALVRQDPEVILVGEIRDAQTAQVAYQAALTGQLVVTTFHATDAASAVVRLLDMGVPAYMLRGATRAVIAQRLLRACCPCRRDALQARTASGQPGDVPCELCRGTGYRGRTVVAEAAKLASSGFQAAIQDGAQRRDLETALRSDGVPSLRDQAEELARRGETDRAEIERLLGNAPAAPHNAAAPHRGA
ncbi:MAG: GspE/PulE family protein [Planctomycetota bacterium]